jgi:hypothetical protein
MYKGWKQWIEFCEARVVPALERYSPDDRRMTRLCRELMSNSNWPPAMPRPLVAALAPDYYGSFPFFHVIYVPAAESTAILGWPDLAHELAHLLYQTEAISLVGDFPRRLATYISSEKALVAAKQRPPAYIPLYDIAREEWVRRWLGEFVCDMVSTYIIGAPYAWQHMRLCVGGRSAAHVPSLGGRGSHPADAARMYATLAVLRGMSAAAAADEIERAWIEYLGVAGERRPTEFDLCYPPALLDALAMSVRAACDHLGLRPFTTAGASEADVVGLAQEAWRRFRANPVGYRRWEEAELAALWLRLGV